MGDVVGSTEQIHARAALLAAVDALRSGDVPFVEGLRRIVALQAPLEAPDFNPDFVVLVAIDFESDHLPNALGKLMASDAWLASTTAEERELQQRHREEVLSACERILARYGHEA
jgi:hypothetical protein